MPPHQTSDIKHQTSAWIDICPLASVPAAGGHYVVHAGRPLAVFRDRSGNVVVTDDACPHAGGSLSAGAVDHDSGCVVCPWHAWAFRLTDGKCPDNPAIGVRRYDTRVENERVQIRA